MSLQAQIEKSNFVSLVDAHGRTMSKGMPSRDVAHPLYGELGTVDYKGFHPTRGRWLSTNAILRDASRETVRRLRRLEDVAPKYALAALVGLVARDYNAVPWVLGTISTYDGIVTARGTGLYDDYWMMLTATSGGVTLMWYDTQQLAWSPGSLPSITAYVNAATGGAVMDSASNSSWVKNPAGSNKRYIVSCGLTTPNITGFSMGMLYDLLWAGSYVVTSNLTIDPTTDVAVTRYSGAAAAGNMGMIALNSTYTQTGAHTLTVNYTDQGGAAASLISVGPASGPLIGRIIHNTLHNSATVVASTPFLPLTNGGKNGMRGLTSVVIAGGTVTAGTFRHMIVRPLIIMPFIAANSYIEQDTTLNIGNMVELVNVTQVCGCLSWVVFTAGATATTMSAFLRTVEG